MGFKIAIIALIVPILAYRHCASGALSKSRTNSNSADGADVENKDKSAKPPPQQYDSDWKAIFIKTVETNGKSNSSKKRDLARKLWKDLQITMKSDKPYHFFRVGNRNVRGYAGEPGSEERIENESFFRRKWNELLELLRRFKNWFKSWFRSEELGSSDDRNNNDNSSKSYLVLDPKKKQFEGRESMAIKRYSSTGEIRRHMADELERLYSIDNVVYYQRESKIQIDRNDLLSLMPPSPGDDGNRDVKLLLTNRIIDAYLYILSHHYERFGYLDTTSLSRLIGIGNGIDSADCSGNVIRIERAIDALPKAGQTHYAIPIAVNGKHWILLTVRFDRKKYSILNPKSYSDSDAAGTKRAIEYLTDSVRDIVTGGGDGDRSYEEVTNDETAWPKDDYNHDVFVCWLAKRFASSSKRDENEQFEADQFRAEMFDRIINTISKGGSLP